MTSYVRSYLLLLPILTLISCKTHSQGTLSDSELKHHNKVNLEEDVGNVDCFVQKVYLLTTLYDMIWEHDRKTNSYFNRITPVEKILHPRVATRIINTVMSREDPACSPKILYGPSCEVVQTNGVKTSTYFFYGHIPKPWWWYQFKLNVTDVLGSKIDTLLTNHFHKHRSYRAKGVSFNHMYCAGICSKGSDQREPEVHYKYNNNFGLCMLKKHENHLKSEGIFDLSPYFDFESRQVGVREFDTQSLQSFINRTQSIRTFEEEAK